MCKRKKRKTDNMFLSYLLAPSKNPFKGAINPNFFNLTIGRENFGS